jgi:hypothetical protein
MATVRSASSSSQRLRILFRLQYLKDLFFMSLRGRHSFDFREWEQNVNMLVERFSTRKISEMTAVEIGCGQRIGRLIWATGLFKHVVGIDLDRPMLKFSLGAALEITRTNGILRALKTSVRSVLFDGGYYRALSRSYEERYGRKANISNELIVVGDAADISCWRACQNVDVIFSEHVFEHIPEESLTKIAEIMATTLADDGLAIININIFTGITGGHIPEWYSGSVNNSMPKRTRPWGHLREERSLGDTYLNELRLHRYKEIFSRSFEILEIQPIRYGLGGDFLTPELEVELAQYSREELLTNFARFVMRPRRYQSQSGSLSAS